MAFQKILLITCWWLLTFYDPAIPFEPGDPPVFPMPTDHREHVPAGARSGEKSIPSSSIKTITIFLPLIQGTGEQLAVDTQDRQASLDFYLEQYVSSEDTAINWTGSHHSCSAGTTDQGFRQAVLRRINYFRAMAGVPASVNFSLESNQMAQAAALIMSANQKLSHSPTTSWICYSCEGKDGAGSSNLYLGVNGWKAITGYMKDPGAGNYAAGHRRWILYPQTQMMGTGDVPSTAGYPAANALRVFDTHLWEARPATREEFVAWPPPGYVPYQVVFPRWSFSYAKADFSAASVTITSKGENLPVEQAPIQNGYGENTLVWIPLGLSDGASWPRPGEDTIYSVTIQNVLINNTSRNFNYKVVVFDPTQ